MSHLESPKINRQRPISHLASWALIASIGFTQQAYGHPTYPNDLLLWCADANLRTVFTADVCSTCHDPAGYSTPTANKTAFLTLRDDPTTRTAGNLAPFCGEIHYIRNDPTAPALHSSPLAQTSGTRNTYEMTLTATEQDVNVAQDVTQQLWTFNGKVPGPVIRVKVGDTVKVHFENPGTNKLPHSVDFHASQTAWNGPMISVAPGNGADSKLDYVWKAEYAGVWMYHCGSNPALHHIASGMYGMVIVEPKQGLPRVDHEFALVQSEFYLGTPPGPGQITSLDHAANMRPDNVVFNGVAFQYKDKPIEIGTGKKVRLFVLNAGPNEDSAFHIVGTIFNRVIKEGIQLTPTNKGHFGSQAVDLAPAQGAIIELTTKEDGLYPIVTHAFNYVGKGALGYLKAGDGDPSN